MHVDNALLITAMTACPTEGRKARRPGLCLVPSAKNEKIISHILRFIGCQVIAGSMRLTKEAGERRLELEATNPLATV